MQWPAGEIKKMPDTVFWKCQDNFLWHLGVTQIVVPSGSPGDVLPPELLKEVWDLLDFMFRGL